MKKPRRSKNKRKRSRGRSGSRGSRAPGHRNDRSFRVRLQVEALELARGHDGFLRGAPEPTIVCAVFASSDGTPVRLLGRGIARFFPPARFPCTVAAQQPEVLDVRVSGHRPERLVVVAIALEEDGGTDVQRAYAAMQRHADLLLLPESSGPEAPQPVELAELARNPTEWFEPRTVLVMQDGTFFDATCRSDKWIGATAVSALCTEQATTYRLHVVAPNGRNDWTAVTTLRS